MDCDVMCKDVLTEIVSHVYDLGTLRSLSLTCMALKDVSQRRISHALLCRDVLINVKRCRHGTDHHSMSKFIYSTYPLSTHQYRYRYGWSVFWSDPTQFSFRGPTLFELTTMQVAHMKFDFVCQYKYVGCSFNGELSSIFH